MLHHTGYEAMVTRRTVLSLAQFLELQNKEFLVVLLEKHILSRSAWITHQVLHDLVEQLTEASEGEVQSLLDEIVRTSGDLRTRVSPRVRFDERFDDLKRCLYLDGYRVEEGRLITIDPSVIGMPALDDDLTAELNMSGLPEANHVIQKIEASATSFRSVAPNYNACLNDARIALQTLATSIAQARVANHPGTFDKMKWGAVVAYLRLTDFVTDEEERGLVGVYGFVSTGSHRPLGLSDEEMARLGRSFVGGMCWFLVKRFKAGA
jgi:hypothetical protein